MEKLQEKVKFDDIKVGDWVCLNQESAQPLRVHMKYEQDNLVVLATDYKAISVKKFTKDQFNAQEYFKYLKD